MREFYICYILDEEVTTEQQDAIWSVRDATPGYARGRPFISMDVEGESGLEAAKTGAEFLLEHGIVVVDIDIVAIVTDYSDPLTYSAYVTEFTDEDRKSFRDWLAVAAIQNYINNRQRRRRYG